MGKGCGKYHRMRPVDDLGIHNMKGSIFREMWVDIYIYFLPGPVNKFQSLYFLWLNYILLCVHMYTTTAIYTHG